MTIGEIRRNLHNGLARSLVGETFSTSYMVNDYFLEAGRSRACVGKDAVVANLERLRCIDIKWRIFGINAYKPVYTRYSSADGQTVLYEKDGQMHERKWNDASCRYEYEACAHCVSGLRADNDSATAQTEQVLVTSNDPSTFSLQGVFSRFSPEYSQSAARAWLNSFDCRQFFMLGRKPYAANGFLAKHLKDTAFLKAICPVHVGGGQWDYVSLPSLNDMGFSAEDVNNCRVDRRLRKKAVSRQFGLDSDMCWMLRDRIGSKTATVREDGLLELNSLDDYDNIAPICTIQ